MLTAPPNPLAWTLLRSSPKLLATLRAFLSSLKNCVDKVRLQPLLDHSSRISSGAGGAWVNCEPEAGVEVLEVRESNPLVFPFPPRESSICLSHFHISTSSTSSRCGTPHEERGAGGGGCFIKRKFYNSGGKRDGMGWVGWNEQGLVGMVRGGGEAQLRVLTNKGGRGTKGGGAVDA